MQNTNKLDFTGKSIYIGMDVHKNSWSVSIHTDQFEHKTFRQPADSHSLVRYLRRNFPGARYKAVYEAGFSGFWIHDQLFQKGVDCMVVNPADVPTNDKERRTKTDRVDCRKLALSLKAGQLKGIYVPQQQHLEDRSLLRTRHSMVKKQSRCKNQIKSLLYFYGHTVPTDRSWSARFVSQLEQTTLTQASGNSSLKAYLEELRHLRHIIAGLNTDIRKLSRSERYNEKVTLLKTIPGISTLTAMTLLTEISDINRFKNLDKLCSFVGLIPDTHSSGDKELTGSITARHNKSLRSILIEASWIAVRKDPALLMAFEKLTERMKKTKAIVHIAHKLLNRIRFVLKNQKPYVSRVV